MEAKKAPIRQSSRKTPQQLRIEENLKIEELIKSNDDTRLGLEIKVFPEKGRGVVATRILMKNDFFLEYSGELIALKAAREREEKYSIEEGCFLFYFKSNNKNYCVDATPESGRLGRLVNHSSKNPNLVMKVVMFEDQPRLILKALVDIKPGTELLYDYGDRQGLF